MGSLSCVRVSIRHTFLIYIYGLFQSFERLVHIPRFFPSFQLSLVVIHLLLHLCIHALIQHNFLLHATRFQALSLTSLLGPYLGPMPVGRTCSDNHGEEVIGTRKGLVTCCGIQRREGCSGLAAEAKAPTSRPGGKGELATWRCGRGLEKGRAPQAEGQVEPRQGVRTAWSRGCADQLWLAALLDKLRFIGATPHPVVHTLCLHTADRR